MFPQENRCQTDVIQIKNTQLLLVSNGFKSFQTTNGGKTTGQNVHSSLETVCNVTEIKD
jgi:hypothetical protein